MRSLQSSYHRLWSGASGIELIVGADQLDAVEADNFRATTTGNLAVPCNTDPPAPNYTAAIRSGAGFASGFKAGQQSPRPP